MIIQKASVSNYRYQAIKCSCHKKLVWKSFLDTILQSRSLWIVWRSLDLFLFLWLPKSLNDNFMVLQKKAFSHKKFQFHLGVQKIQCNKTTYVHQTPNHLWAKQFLICINRPQIARKLLFLLHTFRSLIIRYTRLLGT